MVEWKQCLQSDKRHQGTILAWPQTRQNQHQDPSFNQCEPMQ